jgi:Tol biopolymer transport system component
MKTFVLRLTLLTAAITFGCSDQDKSTDSQPDQPVEPICNRDISGRTDAHQPTSEVADWDAPVRLNDSVNTDCPQDAIEISRDGTQLYVLYLEDVQDNLSAAQMLSRPDNTYMLTRYGDETEFGNRQFVDLGKGATQSLDGELSFSPDGNKVYFHSLRAANLGYQANPPTDDFLDIYVADLTNGVPGPGVNLGEPVNSVYPDGEEAIHPDGVTLYFASHRPGGSGGADIWESTFDGSNWGQPTNLGTTINSATNDYQPAFDASGDTMYYASGRNPLFGMAIYRTHKVVGGWSAPELVMSGLVGEPSLTADGQLLYFVHVLSDGSGNYDTDVWVSRRVAP